MALSRNRVDWAAASSGSATASANIESVAEWSDEVIKFKVSKTYPINTILALDANHLGIMSDVSLLCCYRERFGSPSQRFGFAAVWLVGPTVECCLKLVTVLASNAATQSYGIILQQGMEGTGPPPHSHDWDEAFYVLKGEIHFLCDGNVYDCTVGTLVHVPRGTVHGFRYGTGGGQMLEMTGAGALAAQMFTAIDKEILPGPPDIPKLLDVLTRNGVTVAV